MTKSINRLRGAQIALLAGVALPIPACAQSAAANSTELPAGQNTDAQTGNSAYGEDVIVTARRRSERLIDVPVAVTAVTGEQLQRTGTSNFIDLAKQVPQLMITRVASGNGATVTIRGIGSNLTADDSIDQAVSFNIDGVPTARGRAIQQGLFDLNNVQVLKGPQALFFGKNSPGGVILVESQGPKDHWEGYAQSSYEVAASEFKAEAAVGGPLTDTLGMRVALQGSDMLRGYVRNVAQPISAANDPLAFDRANGLSLPGASFAWGPQSKQVAGRLTLVYRPSSDFNATLKVFGSYYRDNGDGSQVVVLSCAAGETSLRELDRSPLPGLGYVVDPYGTCKRGARTNSIGALPSALAAGYIYGNPDGKQYTRNKNFLSSLTMNWNVGDVTLTSVSSAYLFKNSSVTYSDTTIFSEGSGAGISNFQSYTQELRAVSSFSGSLNFTAGLLYAQEDRTYDATSDIVRNLTPINGFNYSTDVINHQVNNGSTYSAFIELRWSPLKNLEISGGARGTIETKTGNLAVTFVQPAVAAATIHVGSPINARLDEGNISPQATISYRPSSNSMIYAGYRTGFKAGTITNPALIPASATSASVVLKPETITGFEGGYKFQTSDRVFSGDITAYSYRYSDLQSAAFDTATLSVIPRNAGRASIKGVEANLRVAPNETISFRGSAAYNRARYTAFANAQCFSGQTVAAGCVSAEQNLTGQPIARAPEWMLTAGATFDHPIGNNLRFGATADARYSSGYFLEPSDSPYAYQSGFATFEASIRLHPTDDRWELAIIGKNLTNKFYAVVATDRIFTVQPGATQGIPGEPRTVALQARYKF